MKKIKNRTWEKKRVLQGKRTKKPEAYMSTSRIFDVKFNEARRKIERTDFEKD